MSNHSTYGAIIGAAVAYGAQVAQNVAHGGSLTDAHTWTHVDGGKILAGAAAGALIGLAGPLGEGIIGASTGLLGETVGGVVGRIAAGGAEAGVYQIAGNVAQGHHWSDGVGGAVVTGMAFAGVFEAGGAVVRWGAARFAARAVDSADGAVGRAVSAGDCGESFTPDTQVATPQGERAIASLQVGDHVSAYDPVTGTAKTQTVERVFINHDSDRLDVTLAVATTPTTARASSAQHSERAQPAPADVSRQEVIHTTASHPWLSVDQGWVRAGHLRAGEPVRLLDGGVATVVALHALPGVAPMWDLALDATHTFAVGAVQAVVHNCPIPNAGQNQPDIYEKNADHIFRVADGHFADDTPQNRQLLVNTAADPTNLQGTDLFGNDVYTQMQSDGSQTWAYVRNGTEIRDGGINAPQDTRVWDPFTRQLK